MSLTDAERKAVVANCESPDDILLNIEQIDAGFASWGMANRLRDEVVRLSLILASKEVQS